MQITNEQLQNSIIKRRLRKDIDYVIENRRIVLFKTGKKSLQAINREIIETKKNLNKALNFHFSGFKNNTKFAVVVRIATSRRLRELGYSNLEIAYLLNKTRVNVDRYFAIYKERKSNRVELTLIKEAETILREAGF